MKHLALLSAALFLAGCTAPESFFDVDWPEARRAAEVDRAEQLVPTTRPDDLAENNLPDLSGASAEPIELSIEQAAMLALTRNRELNVRLLDPVIVGSFELIERGVFDPELFAEVSYARDRANEVDRGTGAQFGVEGEEILGEAGVRQTLPTGTDVELSVGQNRDTSSRSPEQQEARVGITVTQALLQGFGPAVNLADIRQAQLETRATLFELRGFAEAVLAQAETAYWNYALAVEQIRIFERSLAVAQQQLEEVRQRIDVGLVPRTEEAAAEAEVGLRTQGLIDARADLAVQQLQLLRLLGGDIEPDIELVTTSASTVETEPLVDVDERVQLAIVARPDLAQARLLAERDALEVVQTRNGLLPRLDLFATLGKTGFDGSFAGSFEQVGAENTYDVIVGFRFSHYLDNDTARGLHRAAVATRAQSQRAITNLDQLVRLDVRLAAIEVERARQSIDATAVTKVLRLATLRAEEERFKVGSSTALLVAQAQRDLLAAEIAEIEAIIAYRLGRIALYRAEGSLLDRRGLRLPTLDQ